MTFKETKTLMSVLLAWVCFYFNIDKINEDLWSRKVASNLRDQWSHAIDII